MVDEAMRESGAPVDKKEKDPKDPADEELSEEDAALKENLELLVARAMDKDPGVQKLALESIRSEIRSSTSSMTSVPKPLKFLRPHYSVLKDYFAETSTDDAASRECRTLMADVLSVLAMTMAEEGSRESLSFKLMGSSDAPQSWGHEYVRSLCGEIGQEFAARTDAAADDSGNAMTDSEVKISDLMQLVDEIVPFLISSNAESEACDLLMEVEAVPKLDQYVDETNFSRVCLYLQSCAAYLMEPEDKQVLKVTLDLYKKVNRIPEAIRVAMQLGDDEIVTSIFDSCTDDLVKKQIAFDMARQNAPLKSDTADESLQEIAGNGKLSEQFLSLASDLEVLDAKTPEDIFKTHLVETRTGAAAADSARQNLSSTFVNAFVNMGFGTDKLLQDPSSKWIYKNKDHGMMSAAASQGMIHLWDVDGGLAQVDKYLYAEDTYIKAGTLLAVGIVSAGVRNDCDPALALLTEYIEEADQHALCRSGAVAGLGMAYAGTCMDQILELLTPIVVDSEAPAEVAALAALSLGLVFVGSANEELAATLVQAMSDRVGESGADEVLGMTLVPLSLGLLYLGKQELAEVACQTVSALIGGPLSKVCMTTIEACAYAGTGNVLKIQELLSICGATSSEASESKDDNPGSASQSNMPAPATATPGSATAAGNPQGETAATDSSAPETAGTADHQQSSSTENADEESVTAGEKIVATLGLAIIAMGEELGTEMCLRVYDHLLQYGDPEVRRAVPLGIGLLSMSHPHITRMDTLSKLTHDADEEVALTAILGLGLLGAGTNNSRAANTLRLLSSYYGKSAGLLFVVRIAQGLLHAGKGLVTLNPFHSEKALLNPTALGGILTVLYAAMDLRGTILGKSSFLLYYLSLAARPRMVFVVDENLEPLAVPVRVGQAVDTVGQAGRPKTITGFQTHTSPVLLSAGERAELATEEYIAVSPIIEGCVIVRKNPDYVPPEESK